MKFILAFFFALLAIAFAQVNFVNNRPGGGGRPIGGGGGRPNGGYEPISIGPAYVDNNRPKQFSNPLARGGK